MKFYLAILALIGVSESSGCTLTLGSLGNKLGYPQGINVQRPQSTNYACFPISTQTRPTVQPTKVSITVTPNHTPIPAAVPSQTYVQSSYFPTVDYYPWANNVPTFTSQPVSTTSSHITTTSSQQITTIPITQPTPVTLPITPQVQTQIPISIPATPIQIPTPQPITPTISTPLNPNDWTYNPIQTTPTTTLPNFSSNDGYLFNQDSQTTNLNIPDVTPTPVISSQTTISTTPDFSNINFDDFDFSTLNLDDLFGPTSTSNTTVPSV